MFNTTPKLGHINVYSVSLSLPYCQPSWAQIIECKLNMTLEKCVLLKSLTVSLKDLLKCHAMLSFIRELIVYSSVCINSERDYSKYFWQLTLSNLESLQIYINDLNK